MTDLGAERSRQAIEPLPVAYPSEIRKIRQLLDLTQEEMGSLLGVTPFTWWRWESGKRPMNERYVKQMRDLLKQRKPILEV